ncbi:hypothetical protein Q5752_002938 [Cryptotrichosporon argae]
MIASTANTVTLRGKPTLDPDALSLRCASGHAVPVFTAETAPEFDGGCSARYRELIAGDTVVGSYAATALHSGGPSRFNSCDVIAE